MALQSALRRRMLALRAYRCHANRDPLKVINVVAKDFALMLCLTWLAVLTLWIGSILKRFKWTRIPGKILQGLSFLLYLLGSTGTALLFNSCVERTDWTTALILFGALILLPLLGCTVYYARSLKSWVMTRRLQPARAEID